MSNPIPIIDFAQEKEAPGILGKDILKACADWGKVIDWRFYDKSSILES